MKAIPDNTFLLMKSASEFAYISTLKQFEYYSKEKISMAERTRTNRSRQFGVGLVLALLMTAVILLPGASTTSAQSTGGFSGAILDLVPTGTTISAATTGASGGAFFVQGLVFENRSVLGNCSLDGSDSVGVWRMWGVRAPAPSTTNSVGSPISTSGISTGNVAVVNMSIELRGFNGTLEFQGTLGRVFGAIESAGNPATDLLAITGGTGTFRGASGDAVVTPRINTTTNVACAAGTEGAGGFQLFLKETFKGPRFTNIIP
jgi:hypothetical protein